MGKTWPCKDEAKYFGLETFLRLICHVREQQRHRTWLALTVIVTDWPAQRCRPAPPPLSLLTLAHCTVTHSDEQFWPDGRLSRCLLWYDQSLCPFLSHASGCSFPPVWNFLPPNDARLITHSVNIPTALACEPRPLFCTALLAEQ